MATYPSVTVFPPSFNEQGRAVRLTEAEIRERNAHALAALDAIAAIGDEAEHSETLDYLMRAVEEDRLSERSRFSS
jgi:hypothetical protein